MKKKKQSKKIADRIRVALNFIEIGFRMETGDYFIGPDHPESTKYKVMFNGKDVTNSIRAIIRTNRIK